MPPTFQKVVAACVIRVRRDYSVEKIVCLDAPQFRQQQVVEQFWKGVCSHAMAPLVSFNGRGFDLPVMELAAYDLGLDISAYWPRRERFKGAHLHLDLQDFFSNQGALRFFTGGLNLLAKRIGNVSPDLLACHKARPANRAPPAKMYWVWCRPAGSTGSMAIAWLTPSTPTLSFCAASACKDTSRRPRKANYDATP